MTISVIIPTLNEAENLPRLLAYMAMADPKILLETIIVDGGSTDQTVAIAQARDVRLLHSPKGRAIQMNRGAQVAKGDVLYFVHGDALPPVTFPKDILQAIDEGYPMGCYRFLLESPKPLLRINSFFTRFDFKWCRGGDQSLFIVKRIFEKLGGYRADHIIMEDFEFIERARQTYPFKIIPKNIRVSARKYDRNSYLKVQLANLIVFRMYRKGYPQQVLYDTYKKWLG